MSIHEIEELGAIVGGRGGSVGVESSGKGGWEETRALAFAADAKPACFEEKLN